MRNVPVVVNGGEKIPVWLKDNTSPPEAIVMS